MFYFGTMTVEEYRQYYALNTEGNKLKLRSEQLLHVELTFILEMHRVSFMHAISYYCYS